MSDRRAFDDLREAWSELEPPTPGAVDVTDARTRATIDWLEAAYEHLEPPSPAVPAWARPRARRERVFRLLGLTRAIAAAAAILAVGFGARALLRGDEGDGSRSTELVSKAEGQATPVPILEAPIEPRTPTIHATLRTDGIELRSGKVRLILLDARSGEPTNTPTDNPTDPENAR